MNLRTNLRIDDSGALMNGTDNGGSGDEWVSGEWPV